MVEPAPFEIVHDAAGLHGSDGVRVVTLLDSGGKMFRRRAIKGIGSGNPRSVEWLVVELNGVKVYQSEQGVVVTTQDLQP